PVHELEPKVITPMPRSNDLGASVLDWAKSWSKSTPARNS
ncbi:hypothetical protein A2U01_0105242, partial [Trifolium medium]|nr:hypothetical protein [Trifolium medium]